MALLPVKTGIRGGFAIALWALALLPLLFLTIDAASPIRANQMSQLAGRGIAILAWLLLGATVFGLFAYPPFIPGLRLWFRRLRMRMSIDQGPVVGARSRLKHLETADDHLLIARNSFDMGNLRAAMPHQRPMPRRLEPRHQRAKNARPEISKSDPLPKARPGDCKAPVAMAIMSRAAPPTSPP